MTKCKTFILLTLLLLAGATWAASTLDCGPYVMRHRIAASESLSKESANMLGVTASPSTAVINIMLMSKQTRDTLSGRIHVIVKRASGLMRSLKLRQIKSEDNAIFYAAEFEFSSGEHLDFELTVSALGQPPQAFAFSKTLP